MLTVEISAHVTIDDLVEVADKLPNHALNEFVQRVLALQAKREISLSLPLEEQGLLEEIERQQLPSADKARLSELREKSREGSLTAEEHAALLTYVQRVEQNDLECVSTLIQLAQKRGTTVTEVMRAPDSKRFNIPSVAP